MCVCVKCKMYINSTTKTYKYSCYSVFIIKKLIVYLLTILE